MRSILGFALLISAFLTVPARAASWDDPALWKQSIEHTLDFFDRNAWDEASGSYACEVDLDGHHRSEMRHLIPVSRMIYGLAHGGRLDHARRLYAYMKAKMTHPEARSGAPYFLATYDQAAGRAGEQPVLVVNQQAYGLCGMVALAAKTHDAALQADIQTAADAFYKRFHDDGPARGFFDGYDLATGQPVRTKSYNSTVYVATSFLAEMAADPAARIGGRPCADVLAELGDIVAGKFLADQTGWITENFDADWHPAWRDWQVQDGKTIGVVGHNFQAAWLLMRIGGDANLAVARTILQSMLAKPVHDRVNGGVGDVFERETDQPKWHTNKPWWQNCEAILAITLAIRMGVLRDPAAIRFRDLAVDFYFRAFVDRVRGGEYNTVTADGQPTADAVKANDGKSTYHTVEMARYMLLYLGAR